MKRQILVEVFAKVCNHESLFLGFLKEDLFSFFQIIFQDFLFFIYLYRIVLFLADIVKNITLKIA